MCAAFCKQDFDTPLRCIKFKNPQTGKRLVFPTNGLQRSPSPSSIVAAGRSSCSSSGSQILSLIMFERVPLD